MLKKEAGMNKKLIIEAISGSFKKLNPLVLYRNPIMLIVETGAALTTYFFIKDIAVMDLKSFYFNIQISIWLWVTVLFANFAEAIAEGRGKAQASALRKTRKEVIAKKIVGGKIIEAVSSDLRKDDVVLVSAGELIPSDGEVIEGIASVDESAVTGESAPVIRESGGDRSSVVGGTKVISDWIKIRIMVNPGDTFLDKMIGMVESSKRQKTPNEIALNILLIGLTIIFVFVVVTLEQFTQYSNISVSIPVLAALLVCLIPTTIGGLLSAIGIAGMNRLLNKNVIALSGKAVEAAGDVDVLLLDKTGTITLGNRMADEFMPSKNISIEELANAAWYSSLADETPEGRSIISLCKHKYGVSLSNINLSEVKFIPFTAQTRMSGAVIDGKEILKGAVDAIESYLNENKKILPEELRLISSDVAKNGGTPLAVVSGFKAVGIIYLKDIVKGGIKEKFVELRKMGIKTVMITGDNPLTAASIAIEAGVDDFIAQATPETKLKLIREYQNQGHLVAMTGDGTNDAPALAQSDVGLAMNSGTQSAKEAGNMVDLDSNPTKLLEIVEVGKQLLITRGALTTFSIANDIAKYFAILPAIFMSSFPELSLLNIMRLSSSQSAIMSAVIFNAIIIIILIPLALRGVKFKPSSANQILRKNVFIYGVGGIAAPFIGIKLIDMLLTALGFK
ncbi:MAG: potassium-transporting ATPase subunit KdpB [Candidatus Humimicrobiaceae bacterium]